MNDIKKPNKNRFISALKFKEADRVPNFEFMLMRKNTEAILGTDKMADVRDRYRRLETVWPPRSEQERHDRSALADYSWYLPPEEYRYLLETIGQDVALCPLSWKPKSRKPLCQGVLARSQDGVIADRSDLDQLPPPPSIKEMIAALDHYIEAYKGSDIGVGVMLRSVFCNTYETLGMENFLLKFYDDPELIKILMDKFANYSSQITEAIKNREIDFFAIDDDLCDNTGFIVNPKFIREQWIPRTKEIIAPMISKGIPIGFHCCGNIKNVIPMAIEMGISAINPIQPNCNDIYEYKKEYGSDMCFMGNIDLAGVLVYGTPQEVREDTKRHIEKLASGGGYIVGSSHSITDDVPPENYRAMIEATWEYGRY